MVSQKYFKYVCHLHNFNNFLNVFGSIFAVMLAMDWQGLRRSPSDAADSSFRELMLHDAQDVLHKDLDRLIKTARPEQMAVSHG